MHGRVSFSRLLTAGTPPVNRQSNAYQEEKIVNGIDSKNWEKSQEEMKMRQREDVKIDYPSSLAQLEETELIVITPLPKSEPVTASMVKKNPITPSQQSSSVLQALITPDRSSSGYPPTLSSPSNFKSYSEYLQSLLNSSKP